SRRWAPTSARRSSAPVPARRSCTRSAWPSRTSGAASRMVIWNDLSGKAVIVTGGTRGIGLATGLAVGRRRAGVTLTHKAASADGGEVRRASADAGAPAPDIVEADVTSAEDTEALLDRLRGHHDAIEALVANVAFAQVVRGLDDYALRALLKSIEYTAWP